MYMSICSLIQPDEIRRAHRAFEGVEAGISALRIRSVRWSLHVLSHWHQSTGVKGTLLCSWATYPRLATQQQLFSRRFPGSAPPSWRETQELIAVGNYFLSHGGISLVLNAPVCNGAMWAQLSRCHLLAMFELSGCLPFLVI